MSRLKARKIKVRIIKPKKHKVVFMGTSGFAVPILKALLNSKFLILNSVITQPDRKAGRGQKEKHSPVKQAVLKHKEIKLILQPEKVSQITKKIKELKPDLIIVVAFGQIIPKEILDIPKKGCLNIHPSLLPKYRGPSPIQTVILAGEKTTGVSIILMDEKIDHGPIIANCKLQIANCKFTYRELSRKLAELGAKLLIKTLPKWIKNEIKPKTQDEGKVTYTKIIKKEDGRINWQKSAPEIERLIRAFNPWPGTFTKLKVKSEKHAPYRNGVSGSGLKVLKILRADVINLDSGKQKGEMFLTNKKQLAVQTGKGLLVLEELQLESKAPMRAKDFINGYPEIVGTIFS